MMIPNSPKILMAYEGLIMVQTKVGAEGKENAICYLPTLDELKEQFLLMQPLRDWWAKVVVFKGKQVKPSQEAISSRTLPTPMADGVWHRRRLFKLW